MVTQTNVRPRRRVVLTVADLSALRGAVYFDGTNIGGRLTVLALYAVIGSVACIAIGRRHGLCADQLELAGAASAL